MLDYLAYNCLHKQSRVPVAATSPSMDPQQQLLFASLRELTQYTNAVSESDLSFVRMDPEMAASLDRCGEQLMGSISDIVEIASGTEIGPPVDVQSFNESWKLFTDANDNLLERADTCLDEHSGTKTVDKIAVKPSTIQRTVPFHVMEAAKQSSSIPRPQLHWRDPVQNFDASFTPKITRKPHAKMNLSDSLRNCSAHSVRYPHPYAYEIQNSKYPSNIFEQVVPQPPARLESIQPVWINTKGGLRGMIDEMKSVREIAVDLEHHDYRSYRGFVCLIQISSRSKDWIVDTLALHDEMEILNEVFTDPAILKVLHGANMDIQWLQRDFGVYVVGLFDTYHACCALKPPKKSLAFLTEKYANFMSDKKYQVADWRTRPLTPEMLSYAQSDTHFLLYIYDCLRNDLLVHGRAGMSEVLSASQHVALQRYEHHQIEAEGTKVGGSWQSFLRKYHAKFAQPEVQKPMFITLFLWRDHVARMEDESLQYVLPNHSLINLANVMPTDIPGVLAACRPAPVLVTAKADDIVALIKTEKYERQKLANTAAVQSKTAKMEHVQSKTTTAKPVGIVSDQAPLKPVFGENKDDIQPILLRAEESAFWGRRYDNNTTRRHNADVEAIEKTLHWVVPLPNLSADIYENVKQTKAMDVRPEDPGALAPIPFVDKKRKHDLGEEIVVMKPRANINQREHSVTAIETHQFDYRNAPPVYTSTANGNAAKKNTVQQFNSYQHTDEKRRDSENRPLHYRGPSTGKSGTFASR